LCIVATLQRLLWVESRREPPSFRQAVEHFVELWIVGRADQEFVLQYRADFGSGGEGPLGGAADGVFGELGACVTRACGRLGRGRRSDP
jgi:hypothetical protein